VLAVTRKAAADFELEVEDCRHRSRDTAKDARRDWRAEMGGRGVEGKHANRLRRSNTKGIQTTDFVMCPFLGVT
jgi:hypothetical protein